MFEILTKQNRFAILYRIESAKRPETRARHIERSDSIRESPFAGLV
jgi:uncharacterized protein YdeI (YjbR/CyaY-like superfamily)